MTRAQRLTLLAVAAVAIIATGGCARRWADRQAADAGTRPEALREAPARDD